MSKHKHIPASNEAWESGELGDDLKFAKIFEGDIQPHVDEAIAMQSISIRLPKSLVETFKLLAQEHGLGYQPLMRRVLTRFAEAEMKRVLKEYVAEQQRAVEDPDDDVPPQAAVG